MSYFPLNCFGFLIPGRAHALIIGNQALAVWCEVSILVDQERQKTLQQSHSARLAARLGSGIRTQAQPSKNVSGRGRV